MLNHPDLITSAPENYRGMRDRDPVTGKWKYSFNQLHYLIDRTDVGWSKWGRVQVSNGKVQQMPHYMSAYMALLDDAHPLYKLKGFDARLARSSPPGLNVPLLQTVSTETLEAFMDSECIEPEEIIDAFDYDPTNRQHSVAKLGNDGVRWAMLTLMCDQHPQLRVEPRDAAAEAKAAITRADGACPQCLAPGNQPCRRPTCPQASKEN